MFHDFISGPRKTRLRRREFIREPGARVCLSRINGAYTRG
jgi:hypothetical protein